MTLALSLNTADIPAKHQDPERHCNDQVLSFCSFLSYGGLMATTMSERTVMPPDQPEQLLEVLKALRTRSGSRCPALVDAEGRGFELPQELCEVLGDVIEALAQGLAITVAPTTTVLTTSQAADLLGVSRPTLVRLLEGGEIPFDKPGRHRRVRLEDVLAYRERARRARAAGLDEMVRHAEDAGIYDLPEGVTVERVEEGGDQT